MANQLRATAATVYLHHQSALAIIRIPGARISVLTVTRPGWANFFKETIPL
jgi:hypothetical protein